MIHVIRGKATAQQLAEMLEMHESYIKLAVDIAHGILAGGGEFHADCEAELADEGSWRKDVWGADWDPASKTVRFGALINIRAQDNRSMEIQDPEIQQKVEEIARKLLEK